MKNKFFSLNKIVLLLLLFTSLSVLSQTKYNSLNDACTRRVTDVLKTVYVPSFATGQSAYLNNNSRNFKRLASGYYYYANSNSAFQTNLRGQITNIQTCSQSSGTLQFEDTYTKGLTGDSNYQIDARGDSWYYAAPGNYHPENFYPILTSTYNAENGHLDVIVNTSGFGFGDVAGSYRRFKIEISPIWYTEQQIEALDFRNQRGHDITIFAANFLPNGEIMDSKQIIVHIAGDATSDVPTWFKRSPTKRIGSPSYFPAFSSVVGKNNIQSYGSLNESYGFENQQYLSKGYNLVQHNFNTAIPQSKLIVSEYDDWAYSHGCPRGDQPAALLWLRNTPMNQLYSYFQDIIGIGSQCGLIFSDFEAFGFGVLADQIASNKLASLYRAFKVANPNGILTSYIYAKPIQNRYGITLTQAQMILENEKYNKTFRELAAGFYSKAVTYVDLSSNYTLLTGSENQGYIGDNLGVGITGDYLLTFGESAFYSFVQEMELVRKLAPTQKVLSLYWNTIELLPDWDKKDFWADRRYFMASNDFVYSRIYKPAAPFSDQYNRAMWGNFVGDGQLIWGEMGNAINSFDNYVNGMAITTLAYLPDNPSTNGGSSPIITTIGSDYNQLALFELSLNNDIIPQPSLYADYSINGGSTYYTGEDLKPASAEFKKLPIVRYKKLGNTYLILAMNKHLEHFQNQTIKVRIEGKTIDISLKGQFSTLKRVRLI
jgi:hypothetical protein